jgi:hypothetical protein
MDDSTLITKTGDVVFARNYRQKDCIDVSRITNNVYLGSYENGASGFDGLRMLGITHILTMGHKMPAKYPQDFTYKIFEIKDVETATIEDYFAESIEFIESAIRENPNNRVLVHCWAGISRSTTIVCCYLIKCLAMSYPEALEHVRKARHWINPNVGFREKLKLLAKKLENDNEKENELYERAGSILYFMREEHKINASKYEKILRIFGQIFGPLHPYTLDVRTEMKSFLVE